MVNFTIFAGGYTSYVLSYIFNSEASTLTFLANSTTGDGPSWITLNPYDKSILYATNEVTIGALQSFKISPKAGTLTLLDTVSSGGNGPAYAQPLCEGQVAVMNYGSGDGRIIPTSSGGKVFVDDAPLITFPPPVGGVSNPHQAVQHGSELFVTDLGGNKVWRLGEVGARGSGDWSIHGFVEQPAGSGPRHMGFIDKYLLVLHEEGNTLTLQEVPSYPNGTSEILISETVIPADGPANGIWAAAELLIPPTSPAFPTQYVYATNRNIAVRDPTVPKDPRGDSIAVFKYTPPSGKGKGKKAAPKLELVHQIYTGLEELRGVEFGEPENGGSRYLYALGALSGGLVVFERTADGGLTEVVRDDTVPPRVTLVVVS